MKYTVILSADALQDIEEAYAWLATRTAYASDWYNKLIQSILSLESSPLRCPHAQENATSSEETWQLLHGTRPHLYRIIFAIRGDTVWVIRVLHGSRQP